MLLMLLYQELSIHSISKNTSGGVFLVITFYVGANPQYNITYYNCDINSTWQKFT